MADRVQPGPLNETACAKEAVCIHTKKIFDSCRDKDCIEDLRVFPTTSSQPLLESAFSIRPRSAEVLCIKVHVEEVTFNRGNYAVDATYFYKIRGEACPGGQEVKGLAVFSKRVILFGGEGNARRFSSDDNQNGNDLTAAVEAVDPLALGMKLVDANCPPCSMDMIPEITPEILQSMGEEIVLTPNGRSWYVTLGQFSITRLERDTQLVIPVYNYCFPEKECEGGADEDPCTLFSRVRFPVEEFFPVDSVCRCEEYRDLT
ncbi:MAG: hypothetical protein Q4A39_01820 [Eubacteriales bacterium]|nr:hypothetical protein [Eubacteriales bacterium]